MWKRINNVLKDKNEYHLDPNLKRDSEIAEELFQNTIAYHKYLIPKKIKYFFQHDKSFFIKLFLRYILKLLLILILVFGIFLFIIKIFDLDVDLNKAPKVEKIIDYKKYPIYIPSSGDYKKDSITISKYKTIFKGANYTIFYPDDNTKNYEKWAKDLHGIESNGWDNPYEARRDGSQYWGKYQMGASAREDIGLDKIEWDKWRSNPDLQEAALRLWVEKLYDYMKTDIEKYDGEFLNGWAITESGIIAMAHNVGKDATREFLKSGGKTVPVDGSGKDATRFLVLGNYDLNLKNE